MKHIFLILFTLLFATTALAAPFGGYRPKNTATRVSGEIFDNTTAKVLGAAVTGIDCETSKSNDTTAPSAFTDCTNAETVVGTNGQFWVDLTAAETNITDGEITVKCSATNTNASDYIVKFTTRKAVVADGGIGPLAQGFDGQTLAEGAFTLDLEASEISVDNQFAGDKIALYTTTGAYYASSCIISSTNANERVTTEENLAALHTVGDYYVLRPDAACQLTAAKLQSGAVDKIWAKTKAEVASALGTGAIAVDDMVRFVYERLGGHKVIDNKNTVTRKVYKADGTTVLCTSTIPASGGVYTTGACQ